MIITNKYNLPQALVEFATRKDDTYVRDPQAFGATTLLNGVREIVLKRRHSESIEQDISDMVWMLLGSAVHKIAESHDTSGESEKDYRLVFENGLALRGRVDYYNTTDSAVEDYKTCSVWKVIYQDFDDWKKQGLMYALLLMASGKTVKKLRFHALIKDWKAGDYRLALLKNNFYPEHAMWTWEYEIQPNDLDEISKFVEEKLKEVEKALLLTDDELPVCSPSERWNDGDKYAVKKNGRVTALRVLDSKEEADVYLREQGGDSIEVRKGVDRKCEDYCLVKEFCQHYKGNKGV